MDLECWGKTCLISILNKTNYSSKKMLTTAVSCFLQKNILFFKETGKWHIYHFIYAFICEVNYDKLMFLMLALPLNGCYLLHIIEKSFHLLKLFFSLQPLWAFMCGYWTISNLCQWSSCYLGRLWINTNSWYIIWPSECSTRRRWRNTFEERNKMKGTKLLLSGKLAN